MNKMKLIIVDDEMLIRKLIRMKIDSLQLNVEIVGEYGDTASALEGVEQHEPDIILSDICMPGDDGISFSEMCIKKKPELKIIIITGFNDFDYARRSLKAGVFDYLMKPVKDDELAEAINKASGEIVEERSEKEKQRLLRDEFENNLPALRSVYINQLLASDDVGPEINEKLKELGITYGDVPNSGLRVGILAMRESIDNPNLPIKVQEEVEIFFKSEKMIYVTRDNWGRIIIISSVADFPMEQCLELLVEMLSKKFDCHIISASSDVYSGFEKMHSAYENALNALVYFYVEKNEKKREEVSQSIYSGIWEQMISLVDAGDVEEARNVGKTVLDKVEETSLSTVCHRLNLAMRKLCKDADINWNNFEHENEINNYHNVEELSWWLEERITRLLVVRPGDEQLLLVRKAVDYISEHIENAQLNQNSLANELGVSSSHLSRLMKQYVGKTYGDILSELRLAKMIDLLNNTKLKDRDIGERIGICDAHYLSIWFRKMTGCSVSEYRKKWSL